MTDKIYLEKTDYTCPKCGYPLKQFVDEHKHVIVPQYAACKRCGRAYDIEFEPNIQENYTDVYGVDRENKERLFLKRITAEDIGED